MTCWGTNAYGQVGDSSTTDRDTPTPVTSLDNVALGLLFAGSAVVTIANHVENVRALLRVEIAEQLA